tara:strand:- start:200 stop:1216 length:1017 start_codon:yes stop_codon:yes gene_type:complete
VPTPVNKNKKPDFGPLLHACKTIGLNLKSGSIIIFESTVYPGVTEDICGKELQKNSGLTRGKDFFLGYSPERINPGDKVHTVEKISKVIAAENLKVTKVLEEIYSKLTKGCVFKAKNIKVAEASKVIENAQRDINIAFINEVAKICQKLKISIYDVLDASSTKWNFLPFYPGLVGGHCIGVDPFYLADVAKKIGIKPQVILSGRKINDDMSKFIFKEIDSKIKKVSNILVLGLTFKANVPDIRNSKVIDLVRHFSKKKHNVIVCDPLINERKVEEIYMTSFCDLKKSSFDLVILAVPHTFFLTEKKLKIEELINNSGLVADLTGSWRNNKNLKNYWCL